MISPRWIEATPGVGVPVGGTLLRGGPFRFRARRPRLARWEEHCQECDAPFCYSHCGLYTPAAVVGCRRFVWGIPLREDAATWTGVSADLRLKRWARLKAKIMDPGVSEPWTLGLLLQFETGPKDEPSRAATLAVSASPWSPAVAQLELALDLAPGVHEIFVPPADLSFLAGVRAAEASLCFRDDAPGLLRLYAAHFVGGVERKDGQPLTTRKLVCLDLDGTLWPGAVGDDLPADRMFAGVEKSVKGLRARRLMLAAVSCAREGAALEQLERFGLRDCFGRVHCEVRSKALTIDSLRQEFGLFGGEVVFVDDEPYERLEVQSLVQGVEVLEARLLPGLWLDPTITAATTLAHRTDSATAADIARFHRQLRARIEVRAPRPDEWTRCWELLQRTNRLHLVEWRPDLDELVAAFRDTCAWVRVGICSDTSSDYGLTCLAAARIGEDMASLYALTFSCRVAGRGYPEAFVNACRAALRHRVPAVIASGMSAVHAEPRAYGLREALLKGGSLALPAPVEIEETDL
jgi:FkbH-like protein